jgi:hypothetical protein
MDEEDQSKPHPGLDCQSLDASDLGCRS